MRLKNVRSKKRACCCEQGFTYRALMKTQKCSKTGKTDHATTVTIGDQPFTPKRIGKKYL